jgi:6-phosphofructokinase 1
MDSKTFDFSIASLGERSIFSPIVLSKKAGDYIADYVVDHQYIIYDILVNSEEFTAQHTLGRTFAKQELIQRAGPREMIYFDPSKVHAGIVTCGGLCPGLNNVVYSIVLGLWYLYGVRRISGIQFGYRGFLPEFRLPTVELTPDSVEGIDLQGGTVLGSSRGLGERTKEIVDCMERMNMNILFTIGGDGTQRGAQLICDEVRRRGLKIAVVGVPKTIDNDLSFMERSFGFETAVSLAVNAVASAHIEAHDAIDGIGIVKVMGRESGFIAAHTALAIRDVNYVLVPEVPFDLEGENGLLANLERRIDKRKHAVILVAEGAGQDLLDRSAETDASGNRKLADIGLFLKGSIETYFKQKRREVNIKYIDPSYIIRSAPANASDSLYCARLGTNAVHAAMAGKTEMLISTMHSHYVHVPIAMAVSKKNRLDPESSLWRDVIQATGQPPLMKN